MKKLYIATKNTHKINEIHDILLDIGIDAQGFPDLPEIEETGVTFEENASIKSEFLSKLTEEFVIADDSGIEVDFLNNAPGVYSARYAGVHGDDKANNRKLLKAMENATNRKCRFVCAISLAKDGKTVKNFRGEVEGILGYKEEGSKGFGYDPLFITSCGKTMAELTEKEKNAISHRKNALKQLCDFFAGKHF